jgi:hypothetical protein
MGDVGSRERPEGDTQMTDSTITTSDIQALRSEAVQAGDEVQISVCNKALRGVRWAVAECQRVVDYARAQSA